MLKSVALLGCVLAASTASPLPGFFSPASSGGGGGAAAVPRWLVARDASAWRHAGKPHPERVVELLLALKPRAAGVAALERRFAAVSDPSSPAYGEYVQHDGGGGGGGGGGEEQRASSSSSSPTPASSSIAAMLRPSAASLASLRHELVEMRGLPAAAWRAAFPLRGHGADFLPLRVRASVAERVFGVPLAVYEHVETGASYVRAATPRRPWASTVESKELAAAEAAAEAAQAAQAAMAAGAPPKEAMAPLPPHPLARWVDFVGGLETHLPSQQLQVLSHVGRGGLTSPRQAQQTIDMDDAEEQEEQEEQEQQEEQERGMGHGGAAAAVTAAGAAPAPAATRRRLLAAAAPPLFDGPHVPSAAAHQVQFANPLAWRGSNISALVLPRCKDGALAPSISGCAMGMGLRTLRLALVPDDKSVAPRKDHFACDGNEYYPDVKDKKWYPQTDITPFCKPCSEYSSGYHFGVDTHKLCVQMAAALGVPPARRGSVLACLFNFNAQEFVGVKLQLQLELFFEHSSPEPARALGACAPGVDADAFLCDAAFTPQPRVTPRWLHKFYRIPRKLHGSGSLQGNAMAAVEFLGRSFDPLDVAQFLRSDHVAPQAVAKVVGQNQAGAKRNSGEATQDVEVMLSVAPLVPTWFWATAGHRPGKGNNEPFLRWLLDVAKTKKPPLVQAVSYADDEAALPRAYTDRINAELMKAALRGITILFESGVDGAGGAAARAAPPNRTSVSGSCGAFRPQFPASSPFATSVGSTALQRVGGALAEVVCDSYLGVGMTSGGGFSRRYAQPLYQRRAVARYLARYPQPPEAFVGEKGVGKSKRGYPDVAAMAPHFAMFERRRSASALGATSAATATVGGMVALLNDARLAGGLPPLGFVNPLLYSLDQTFSSSSSSAKKGAHHRTPFKDVVYGNNRCSALAGHCCKEGYHAAPGWDACTGLGSIDFGALSAKLNTYLGACLGMDCGGGKCSRGVCVCNDNFEKNAAGRCIPLPPFPKKKLEEAAGGFVSFMFFCVCCAMCRGGGGDDDGRGGQRKKPGCCTRLRKCIFPYKFVLVRGGAKNKPAAPADEMGVLGGSAGGAAPGTFGGGAAAAQSFTAVPTQPPASEQGFSNAYQGGYSGGYDGGGGGGGAASNISYTSSTYGESGADMII